MKVNSKCLITWKWHQRISKAIIVCQTKFIQIQIVYSRNAKIIFKFFCIQRDQNQISRYQTFYSICKFAVHRNLLMFRIYVNLKYYFIFYCYRLHLLLHKLLQRQKWNLCSQHQQPRTLLSAGFATENRKGTFYKQLLIFY